MPPRSQPAMLPHHRYFPVAVLHVLTAERHQRSARHIGRLDPRRLKDPPTQPPQTKIELVILILNQLRIENTGTIEHRTVPASQIYGVDLAFVAGIVCLAAAGAERGSKSRGDGLADGSSAYCYPWAPDIMRAACLQDRHAFADIVGRIGGVRVHSYDDLAG